MSTDYEELLGEEFNGNAPAAAEGIAAAERALSKPLPRDFQEFLQLTNGGEGHIGDNYVMLWRAEELGRYNEDYQVTEYAPGLLLFGSDGGGEGFAFDTRTTPPTVVTVPFVGMSLKYAKPVALTFTAFLEKLGE
ncbi:MAG TPA: SMI1/KNR4 family protein [Thermoanaerobaculia bacterium]|jgi:hypothetical protein|nr:SMI1/KNR4 family protein [Thermoanaerobaculia bacterium]